MKTLLIAGSRDIPRDKAMAAIDEAYWHLPGLAPDILVTGDARGVDTYGQEWWLEYLGGEDTIEHYPADWDTYGKSAGYRRNAEMAKVTDQAIIVWDGESKGTRHMMALLDEHNVDYVVAEVV